MNHSHQFIKLLTTLVIALVLIVASLSTVTQLVGAQSVSEFREEARGCRGFSLAPALICPNEAISATINGIDDGPDLVVSDLIAGTNAVVVIIKNQGTVPITNTFWVDVYINPTILPTGVNQPWISLGSQGLVWGVDASALPIAANGGTLILTINDAYYRDSQSSVNLPLPAGSTVYAQVDSINYITAYGAVQESHELSGGTYNNITNTLAISNLPPILKVGPNNLNYQAIVNDDNPAVQPFTVTNIGSATYTWTLSETIDWLTLSATSGSVSATVDASVDINGLNTGVYTGLITVSSSAQGSPQAVYVSLNVSNNVTNTIDPVIGGVITSADNMVNVAFPAGAVTTTTTITIATATSATHSTFGFNFAGQAVDIRAVNTDGIPVTQFNQFFTLTFSYVESDWQNAGISNENDLNLYYWNGSVWQEMLPCAGCFHNTENNKFIILLDHLTEFALLEDNKVNLPIILKGN